MSKGSNRRPSDPAKYEEGWDKAFGKQACDEARYADGERVLCIHPDGKNHKGGCVFPVRKSA